MEKCECCGMVLQQEWLFCPACGKCARPPESSPEVILRGLLSYHERVTIAQDLNPGTDSPIMDIYAEALRKAIQALRKMGQEN